MTGVSQAGRIEGADDGRDCSLSTRPGHTQHWAVHLRGQLLGSQNPDRLEAFRDTTLPLSNSMACLGKAKLFPTLWSGDDQPTIPPALTKMRAAPHFSGKSRMGSHRRIDNPLKCLGGDSCSVF